MAEVIVGHRGFGVLVQGLPKFAGVDIEELAGVLFTFCLVNDRRSIEVELEVREVLSKFPRLVRVESGCCPVATGWHRRVSHSYDEGVMYRGCDVFWGKQA